MKRREKPETLKDKKNLIFKHKKDPVEFYHHKLPQKLKRIKLNKHIKFIEKNELPIHHHDYNDENNGEFHKEI
jgi:hypothetical protein